MDFFLEECKGKRMSLETEHSGNTHTCFFPLKPTIPTHGGTTEVYLVVVFVVTVVLLDYMVSFLVTLLAMMVDSKRGEELWNPSGSITSPLRRYKYIWSIRHSSTNIPRKPLPEPEYKV
jgi:hypothetical protein